jgi:hypothetical protein
VAFNRTFRNSYPYAEACLDELALAEVYPRGLSIGEVPGYRSIDLSFEQLRLIVGQGLEIWRAAAASIAGVYLISDTETGKLYVG